MTEQCPNCGKSYPYCVTSVCRCTQYEYALYFPNMVTPDEWESVYLQADNLKQAAEKIHEANFAHWDYSTCVEIFVREPGNGWRVFVVDVETIPSFRAGEKTL